MQFKWGKKWFDYPPSIIWNCGLSLVIGYKMCLRPSAFVLQHLYDLWFPHIVAIKSSCSLYLIRVEMLDSCQHYWRLVLYEFMSGSSEEKKLTFFFVSALVSQGVIEEEAFSFEMEEQCWIFLSCSTFIPQIQAGCWLKSHSILQYWACPSHCLSLCVSTGLCVGMGGFESGLKWFKYLEPRNVPLTYWTLSSSPLFVGQWGCFAFCHPCGNFFFFLTPGDKLVEAPWLRVFR